MVNKRQVKNITFLLIFILFDKVDLFSQEAGTDFYTSMGKMYIVVGVIIIIFLGLVYFLVRMDRRIKKLEEEIPTIK